MKPPKAKDKMLDYLIRHNGWAESEQIAKDLSIPHFSAFALLREIENDKYVRLTLTTTVDSHYRTCTAYLEQEGIHFRAVNSYQRLAFWKAVENLPKKYWFIGVLITSLGFNVKDLLQYIEQQKKQKPKTESSIEHRKPVPSRKQ